MLWGTNYEPYFCITEKVLTLQKPPNLKISSVLLSPSQPHSRYAYVLFSCLPSLNLTTQKSALEIHDYQAKTQTPSKTAITEKSQQIGDPGNTFAEAAKANLPISQNDPQSKRTPSRGDLEQAIRSMRHGNMGTRKRVEQHSLRLSKIFVDGNDSRQSHI